MSKFDGQLVTCSVCGTVGHEKDFIITGHDVRCPDRDDYIEQMMRKQEQEEREFEGHRHETPNFPDLRGDWEGSDHGSLF